MHDNEHSQTGSGPIWWNSHQDNDSHEHDMSGESPQPPSKKYQNALLQEDRAMYLERRVMRVATYVIVLLIGVTFLCSGLSLTKKASEFILEQLTKPQTINVVTAHQDEPTVTPSESKSKASSTQGKYEHVSQPQEWLPTGSVITLIAFVLGVGLTLVLTLIRNVFKSIDAQGEKGEKQSIGSDLATPLSKLIEELISVVRRRFAGK